MNTQGFKCSEKQWINWGYLGYHALHASTTDVQVQTPLEHTSGVELDKTVHVIPILRAGLSLVQGILHFVPNAKVGHIVCTVITKHMSPLITTTIYLKD